MSRTTQAEHGRSNPETNKHLANAQRNEITEHHVYQKILSSLSDPHNREVLDRIAADELKHYEFLKEHTGLDIEPDRLKIRKYTLVSKIFGITFAIKLMEGGEGKAQQAYEELADYLPEIKPIIGDETEHEKELADLPFLRRWIFC